jgi:hypothetical protein
MQAGIAARAHCCVVGQPYSLQRQSSTSVMQLNQFAITINDGASYQHNIYVIIFKGDESS